MTTEHDPLGDDIAHALQARAEDVDHLAASRLLQRLPQAAHQPVRGRSYAWRSVAVAGLAAALVLVALVPLVLFSSVGGDRRAVPGPQPTTGTTGTTGQDPVTLTGQALDGQPGSTTDYLGQPLVVTVWGSWCLPCRELATELSGTSGVQVLGISAREVSREPARAFAEQAGLTFRTLFDLDVGSRTRLDGLLGRTGYPTTLLLDARGRVTERWNGVVDVPVVLDSVERLQEDQPVVLLLARQSGGRDALITGRLRLLGNCAGVEDTVVIWPEGTTVVEASPVALDIPGVGVVRSGDQVSGAGGFFDTATDDVAVRIPRSCGTTGGATFRVE